MASRASAAQRSAGASESFARPRFGHVPGACCAGRQSRSATLPTSQAHSPPSGVSVSYLFSTEQCAAPQFSIPGSPRLNSRKYPWGEYPMSSNHFLCFSQAMRESRFLRCTRSTEAQLPPPNPNPTGIQIHWIESAGIPIEIQLRQVKPATEDRDLKWKHLSQQGYDGPFGLEAEAQKMFVSKPRRRTV
jgi:hypothetical protein